MRILFLIILLSIANVAMYAQIGYQVALLNHANGEPRRNETVSIKVDITDSADHVIYSQTQNATTNDFGLISLNIGNESTFKDVDWSKLPLFISATVDGVMVGKSQILNVPVAEYALKAKELDGCITASYIVGIWRYEKEGSHVEVITFDKNGKFRYEKENYKGELELWAEGTYRILSNGLILTDTSGGYVYDEYDDHPIYCDAVGKIDDNHIITITDQGRFPEMTIYTRQ